ncbi:MAG: class III extradiol ring-cleavage dioxygenase [Tenuifilaceae bacterium]|nr:class III extradiol ring-cleavage dioxygenase [Tenuifilaceae bacterium]
MANIVYFSHGGGPLPILGDSSHKEMVSFMRKLPEGLMRPEAIIVVSAHWEEDVPSIVASPNPSLLYDYYGFPMEAYEIEYSFPGNIQLANRIKDLFGENRMPVSVDAKRGLDHGVFIPLLLMYPGEVIPVTQISLIRGLDPTIHLTIGKVLNQLINENILIIGSGFSFHNMRAFDWTGGNTPDEKNDGFQDWLVDVCTGSYTQDERDYKLQNWATAPNARYCHPREEHLIPLHVCCGAAQKKGEVIFDNYILGKRAIAVKW